MNLNVSNVIMLGPRKVSAKEGLSTHLSLKTLSSHIFERIKRIGNEDLERAWNVDFLYQHIIKRTYGIWIVVVPRI